MSKLKAKIKALLLKTEENGCTKEEAMIALTKARQLMIENAITESEVMHPNEGEEIVERKYMKFKTWYDIDIFCNELQDYFDCTGYRTRKYEYVNDEPIRYIEGTVIGYQSDVELFLYFYDFIYRSAFGDLDREYEALKAAYPGVHGRTLKANFLNAYMIEIAQRLEQMYLARKNERHGEQGLVLYDKRKDVDDFYKALELNIKESREVPLKVDQGSQEGAEAASRLNIIQGVNEQSGVLKIANGNSCKRSSAPL